MSRFELRPYPQILNYFQAKVFPSNQQWAGTDACEPVTWQECKLVPKDVKFIVPEITCVDKQELWYHEPEEAKETRMTNTYSCKVEQTTDCETTTRPDCKTISWQDCR